MNDPITWGDYFAWRFVAALVGVAVLAALTLLGAWSDGRFCPTCARRLQWRLRRPHALAPRRFCPFHDGGFS